jgi:hypothetical protein
MLKQKLSRRGVGGRGAGGERFCAGRTRKARIIGSTEGRRHGVRLSESVAVGSPGD